MATSIIIDDKKIKLKKIETSDFNKTVIRYNKPVTIVNEVLPFRVRFQTIGIEGYGPSNPAGIGIAIVGLNNYIL
jgi:hypothetical protein